MTNLDSIFKSRDITLPTKVHQGYRFSRTHVWIWELDCEEGWVPKNWCFWTVVLENILESPLDCMETKPVTPTRNQPWIFIRRTDAEAAILWPPDAKSQLIGKDPDTGKDWGQEEKGATEDDVIGWHHWLKGREYAQAPGDGEGQGSLACCSPRNRRVGHDLAAGQQQRRTPIYWALLLCRCQFVPFMWIISNNWDTTTLIYRYKNWS